MHSALQCISSRKLSWFMISKWFLVQLGCFIGAWQIFMLKVSLSTKKTPSHLSDYCVSVTLSFPETACLIQPDLAESILICQPETEYAALLNISLVSFNRGFQLNWAGAPPCLKPQLEESDVSICTKFKHYKFNCDPSFLHLKIKRFSL